MTILEFLYNTVPGRFLLKPLTGPRLSRICGHFLDSELSSFLIQPFVKQNAIQLSDYETTDIKSFNDFFIRKLIPEARPINKDKNILISPGDGRLLAYTNIDINSLIQVKGITYSLSELLEDNPIANEYAGGTCLVLRLCPIDYHRLHFICLLYTSPSPRD